MKKETVVTLYNYSKSDDITTIATFLKRGRKIEPLRVDKFKGKLIEIVDMRVSV